MLIGQTQTVTTSALPRDACHQSNRTVSRRKSDAVAAANTSGASPTPLGNSTTPERLEPSHGTLNMTPPWDETGPDGGGGHAGGGHSGGEDRAYASAASHRQTGGVSATTGHGSSPIATGGFTTAESMLGGTDLRKHEQDEVGFASRGGLYDLGGSAGTGILTQESARGIRCGGFNLLAEGEAANDHVRYRSSQLNYVVEQYGSRVA